MPGGLVIANILACGVFSSICGSSPATADVPLTTVLRGSLPFVLLMFLAMVLIAVFPDIALWLPNQMMGFG